MSLRTPEYFNERDIKRTLLHLKSTDKDRLLRLTERYTLSQPELIGVLLEALETIPSVEEQMRPLIELRRAAVEAEKSSKKPMSKRAIVGALASADSNQIAAIQAILKGKQP